MQMEHNQDLAMVVLRPLASAWKIGPNDQEKRGGIFLAGFLGSEFTMCRRTVKEENVYKMQRKIAKS
jgi:hypothetical protein